MGGHKSSSRLLYSSITFLSKIDVLCFIRNDFLKSIKHRREKAECHKKRIGFEVRQDMKSMFWQLLLHDPGQIM